ncbi:hypothetical protein ACU4GR_13415 [Methylobacterium oryzae CBMB20]
MFQIAKADIHKTCASPGARSTARHAEVDGLAAGMVVLLEPSPGSGTARGNQAVAAIAEA